MSGRRVLAALGAAALLCTVPALLPTAASATDRRPGVGHAAGPLRSGPAEPLRFGSLPPHNMSGGRSAATPPLTTFTGGFFSGGLFYPYRMVGTRPAGAAATTTVPTVIIPVKVQSSDGSFTVPSGAVPQTAGSALFTNAAFSSGVTQYGDAMLRASFWSSVRTKNWHVRLGAPAIAPTLTLTPPSDKSRAITGPGGGVNELVDITWFDNHILPLATTYGANVLPIFLAYDVRLCDPYPTGCGIGGYHNLATTSTGQHTYAYASWMDPGVFGNGGSDLAALSHEIAEWLFDPYVDNRTPAWRVPTAPQYGCSSFLETGDPLVGTVFRVGGLTMQDEAFLSWFARKRPSTGIGGRYTYLGTFTTFSPRC